MEEIDILNDPLLDTKERFARLSALLIKKQHERDEAEKELEKRVKEIADKLDAVGRGIEKQESWFKKFIADVMKYAISILKL